MHSTLCLLGRWPLLLQAEALAVLDERALAHHVPERALEPGLLSGVQPGQPEQFLDSERMLRLRQVPLHVLRQFNHKRSQARQTG
jgi:hypothetical protein